MQMLRQKDLKKNLQGKLKEISSSERKVFEMYKDIQGEFKSHITDISQKVTDLESSNYSIKERIFSIEKDIEKDKLKEKMILNGIKFNSGEFLKDDLDSACRSRLSCNLCIDDPKCVWCGMEKRCTLGGPNGPKDGTCMRSFEYATCSNSPCYFYSDCYTCTLYEECGWCDSTSTCTEGNKFSPDKYFCPRNYIHRRNKKSCNKIK
jgi:hypothetical protein